MLDLLIRGGEVVDGTGAPSRRVDVGVRDGRIAAIGDTAASDSTRRVLDLEGRMLVPGFVDVHTHYDAQVFWDGGLTPSPFHGVTTVVAGNCGLTLAPVADEHADFLIRLLARVEQIPVPALLAGVDIRWRTFAEFLAAVARQPLAINVGFMVGHSALRRCAMGEAASSDVANDAQIAHMQSMLRDALSAGAFGLSSSTSLNHRDGDGRKTPPNFATPDEFLSLADVVGEFEGTCLEHIPGSFITGFDETDARVMADMSARANRHLNWNTVLINSAERELWRRQLAITDAARSRGGWIVPQAIPHNFRTRTDLADAELGFRNLPGWDELFVLAPDARLAALREPTLRARLRHHLDTAVNPFAKLYRDALHQVLVNDADDGPVRALIGRTLSSLATERRTTPLDVVFDLAIESNLSVGFVRHAFDANDDELQQARREMLRDPRVVLGASDGGAHVDGTMNTEYTTACFEELVRRRGWYTFEEMVQQLSDVPARLFGLHDRGRIVEGARADLLVVDPEQIAPGPAALVHDLPSGARRFLARAVGIDRVIVGGVDVVIDQQLTGAHPGNVLRSGIDSVTVPAH